MLSQHWQHPCPKLARLIEIGGFNDRTSDLQGCAGAASVKLRPGARGRALSASGVGASAEFDEQIMLCGERAIRRRKRVTEG
jgi:hypothetical protein